MAIDVIRALGVCCVAGILRTYACETTLCQVFPSEGLQREDCEFYLSECSLARTNFAVSAVMNYLRYRHDPSRASEYSLQAWTDSAWPNVPPMEYVIAGVDIEKTETRISHFSVKHISVYAELSMFLVVFSMDGEFRFAAYFNENTGTVGFSFQEAVASNLKFRGVPNYPYLSEHEIAGQMRFESKLWKELLPPTDADGGSMHRLVPQNKSWIKLPDADSSILTIMKHQPFDLEVDIDI